MIRLDRIGIGQAFAAIGLVSNSDQERRVAGAEGASEEHD